MALTSYRKKRNFKVSPEPIGGTPDGNRLRFVIQKHAASHLHYDFRLEMEGLLKSWAVPKGPSTDPEVKRLAMMVEDHPYDYRSFEGIIPSGYGAGTVMVWDEGYYEPAFATGKKKADQDKALRRQLHAGKITFNLFGKKLKGEYALVKAHGRGENGWLLFKVKDKYAKTTDITLKNKSVVSKKTLDQIKKTSKEEWPAHKEKKMAGKTKIDKLPTEKESPETETLEPSAPVDIKTILAAAPKAKFPVLFKPMLATLVDKPFESNDWVYEVKWDGYRAVGFINKGKVDLKSRNDKSFLDKFYPVIDALRNWKVNAVIDGEIAVLNENGISNFGALQNWRSEADGDLYYFIFDIMWLDGKDLTQLPLSYRQLILDSLVQDNEILRRSKVFQTSGIEFFEAAKQMGLEGIIAKKADSTYDAGDRSDNWLKIKANKRQEMVIGGYTKNDDSSKLFSSLLVGVFDQGKLIYTGKVGTGFNEKTQAQMLKQFKPLIIKAPPFEEIPDINKPSRFRYKPPYAIATWLKPQLVCEVSFAEMTNDGVMRHPSFEGMRMDKMASAVILEKAAAIAKFKDAQPKPTHAAKERLKKSAESKTKPKTKLVSSSTKATSIVKATGKKDRKSLLNPTEETQIKIVNGHELKFSNLSKLYWPIDKITKRDMLNYYYQVAPYILPYLKNRPQSMNRHPDGIQGESFYFKDVTGKAPGWVTTFAYKSGEDDQKNRNYLVAKDDASILYMASLGCIEMNPWHSRVEAEDYPDWCIIDLDPGSTTFEQVIEAANVTKNILDDMKVTAYPKTSGSKGIHIYIPLGAKYTYEQSKEFARVVVTLVHEQIPNYTSILRAVKDRKGKMYLDFLQNRPGATVSAPYCLRPKPGATVSMPLYWDEVQKGLQIKDFTIHNALTRIQSEGDIFKPVLGKGIDIEKIVEAYASA